MASLNKVFLMGNLTKDPEVRYIPSGTAVCEFGLAVNESYKGRDGNAVDQTVFVDIVVWERQAETCGEYLRKGSAVLLEGRLQLDKWKTKEGENRSKMRVRADRVQFLGSPRGGAAYKDSDGEQGGAEPVAESPRGEPGPGAGSGAEPAGAADDDNLPF